MTGGQYLRTNYRKTGGLSNAVALADGILHGSWVGGAGAQIGPIVMGSFSGAMPGVAGVGSNTVKIEAISAMASYFGCDRIGEGSGYKIYPFYVQPKLNASAINSFSNELWFGSLSTSVGASQMFFWYGGSDLSVASGTTSAGQSAMFFWVGLIVSSP